MGYQRSSGVRSVRSKLGIVKRRILHNQASPWSRIEDVDGESRPLDGFRFYGVLGTWNEEDVVEACVRNASVQGCEQVFLVDNASDDETVARALAVGGTLARRYSTEQYDERLRIRLMQQVVESVSRDSGAAHVWWLWLDADEFSHGRSSLTLRQQLQTLDRKFRILGARWLNHYPSGAPQYQRGQHPLNYQPLAEEISTLSCPMRHRKHPLQRWDAEGPKVRSSGGFHAAASSVTLIEPRDFVITHHFPFRDETITRDRLARLWEASSPGGKSRAPLHTRDKRATHMWSRHQSLDAVYSQNWKEVLKFDDRGLETSRGVDLHHWTKLVDPEDAIVEGPS